METLDLSPLLSMEPLRVCAPEPLPPPKPNRRRLLAVLARLAELKTEGLRLYRAIPVGELFHACQSKFRIAEGSNRSCKTTTGCAELARAVCACDPFDKYPRHGGVALIVGLKEDNIAMLWRKLAEPGAFKVIADEHTGLLRAVRPDPNDPLHIDPYDLAYQEKWRDSPPLLPTRLCNHRRDVAWSDHAKGVPRTVKIPATGWRIEMRPSGSRPDQGDHYNYVQNDEEMEHSDWYTEEIRGLTGLSESPQHTPRMVWTATSQVANPAFAELREKADGNLTGYSRFIFLIRDNPFVPDAEKKAFYDALLEDERDCRYHGIPAVLGRRVYNTYEPMGIHGCEPFEVPTDWCRYAVVDPGTEICATLLAAVDPDEQHTWIYGGFILRKAEATQWAYELKRHEQGVAFESIVMDERAGKERSFNAADTTAQRFSYALDQADVQVRSHGPLAGFFPGTPDLKARTMALRNWMILRPEGPHRGTPRLQVMKGIMPELDRQIKNATCDKRDPEKRAKIEGHACDVLDAMEYLAAFDPRYYRPEPVENSSSISTAVADFQQWQRRHTKNKSLYSGASLG